MEWVETTGATVEEARERALDELGVDEQDAVFEVVDLPKMGLFGRVRVEARVRARVRPTAPRAKEDRRDRRRRARREAAAARTDQDLTPVGTPRDGDHPGVGASGVGASEDVTSEDRAGGLPGAGPSRRRRRGRSGSRRRTTAGVAALGPVARPANAGEDAARLANPHEDARSADSDEDTAEEGEQLMDVALDEQAKAAAGFLEGLLQAFALPAQITTAVDEADERIEVRIDGDHLGMLIGPKGATLLAVQDLARTVVQAHTNARNGRLTVDVAGYREKRSAALADFTRRVAEQVRTTGTPVALEPMNPADRKVVHDTVNQLDGVATRSEGEDDRRHVVVLPDPGPA